MDVSANWIAAIASALSAIVIAVSAAAAFVQIRHVRTSNEITVFLKMVDRLDSLESEAVFTGIDAFVARVASDVAFRKELASVAVVAELRPIANLMQFLEHLSTLVLTGRMSEDLVFAEYAENIVALWARLAETIYLRRLVRGRYLAAAFEHLAMRASDYLAAGGMERLYGNVRKDQSMATFVSPLEEPGVPAV